jgi:hypothetical protein
VRFEYDDGGRAAAGFPSLVLAAGGPGDCQCRAITLATGRPYAEIHAELSELAAGGAHDVDNGAGPDVAKYWLRRAGQTFTLNREVGPRGAVRHRTVRDLPRTGAFVLVFMGKTQGHLSALVDGVNRDLEDHLDSNLWGWWSKA